MKSPDSLNSVSKFHITFQHPILPSPLMPDKSRCELRVKLIQEELNELSEAIANNDLVEVADALCDLQYVLSGAVLEFGMGDIFNSLFEEVQRSNMSKACKTIEEAENTIQHYEKLDGTAAYYQEKDGLYLVYRKSDNKTLKSINYSPANIKSLIS